jgi:cell division protein FtsI/penicillin-binding protein 2
VTEALKSVVSEGTAARTFAEINKANRVLYSFAGKTGTAQLFENGAYSHTKHLSSFLGFLPADDPQLCILVMVRAPQTKKDYGAEVSLPSFINVGCQAAEILNIPHDIPDTTPLTISNPTTDAVGGGTHEAR